MDQDAEVIGVHIAAFEIFYRVVRHFGRKGAAVAAVEGSFVGECTGWSAKELGWTHHHICRNAHLLILEPPSPSAPAGHALARTMSAPVRNAHSHHGFPKRPAKRGTPVAHQETRPCAPSTGQPGWTIRPVLACCKKRQQKQQHEWRLAHGIRPIDHDATRRPRTSVHQHKIEIAGARLDWQIAWQAIWPARILHRILPTAPALFPFWQTARSVGWHC
jgi:hypothetical protein